VFFPDYHLAPEYPYPAALEDIRSLYKYVGDHAEELEIDVSRIGLAGDSAGATIAALICNEYERKKLIRPCLQIFLRRMRRYAMDQIAERKEHHE